MIIPIRCFTCNNIIASKYNKYLELSQNTHENMIDNDIINTIDNKELFNKNFEKNMDIFKQLGIERYCCKRHLLTHVNLIENI